MGESFTAGAVPALLFQMTDSKGKFDVKTQIAFRSSEKQTWPQALQRTPGISAIVSRRLWNVRRSYLELLANTIR